MQIKDIRLSVIVNTTCTHKENATLAKTVVLTGVHSGPHQTFYTGVKFLVLAQYSVVLF